MRCTNCGKTFRKGQAKAGDSAWCPSCIEIYHPGLNAKERKMRANNVKEEARLSREKGRRW